MGNGQNNGRRPRSFSWVLLVSMVVLILCLVGFLTINDYLYTRDNFDREKHLLEIQTEQNINEALRFKDATVNIFDLVLNERMERGLLVLVSEYEQAGRNPDRMNLAGIRSRLGSDCEIYIINASGIITHTTYGPELGTDFRTVPYFYDYLTKIRTQDGFYPDRVVRDLMGTGTYRKFAYMPTPDHNYILELGLTGRNVALVTEERDDLGTVSRVAEVNPYIEKVRVFNSMGRDTDDNSLPEEPARSSITAAINTRTDIEVQDPAHSRIVRYIFVDLKQDRYGSDPSRVVEITYSTRSINDALARLLFFHVLVALCAILLGSILALFISRRITRPIQEIVSDADLIARGDLDHHIRPMDSSEFAVMRASINTMVDSLRTASRKMEDDAIFQKEMINRLPVGIFIKNALNGRYIFWNDACSDLFGVGGEQVLGRTDRELFPADIVNTIEDEDRLLLLARGEVKNKILPDRYFGDRIIHMIIVPIFGSDGAPQFILGISRDVSHENVNLKMDLLFSITRQDILDNLSVIMSHLERAQLKNTHDDMQKFFDKTIASIESIRNQLASMRALQELGIVSPRWIPVRQAFLDAVRLLPDTRVDIRADVGSLEIYGDPLLPRIFYTLLENSLRNGDRKISMIRLSEHHDGRVLHLVYEDDGFGIPDAEKERIFETGYEGTWQGLFLVRELLAFTRIGIRETGNPEKGVRFEISIPEDRFREPS